MKLFNLLNNVATMMLVIYNLLHYKEKRKILGGVSQRAIEYFASKQRRFLSAIGFWVVLETLIISAFQHVIGGYFNSVFGELFHTGANYFGMLFVAPLLVMLVCMMLKIDPLAQLDLITPAYPLALIFTKLACFAEGCCRGFAWEYGFYNPVSTLTEFPAQLLEAAMALILFVFLMIWKRKLKKGTVFPVYLTVYSATRFFTEFTRCEPRTFHGLKTYQVICLVGVLVGLLEYFLVCRYNVRTQRKERIP